ncbi:MAG: nodulation protein V, partial [Byssovorax sp.]
MLMFLPDDTTTPAMAAITAGLRASVIAGWDGPVTFGVEHLDLSWFTSPEYEAQMHDFYRVKYRGYRPSVIVALGVDAIPILLEMRRRLWPGVPVVFLSEDERAASKLAGEPDLTGMWIHFEVRRTVESALQLFPGTRRVTVVLGSGPWEQAQRARLAEELAPLGSRVEITCTYGLSYAELERRLHELPDDAVVVFHTFFLDGAGQRFVGMRLLDRLRPVLRRPMFTVHAVGLDHGVVGGAMIDYERLGHEGGAVLLRVLHGEAAASIPIHAADASVLAFDARELDRFGVPERLVPAGAEVRFREPSLWSRYRWQATAVAAAVALQAALIVVLLVERRRRVRAQASAGRAERETQGAREQLAHLNRVAAIGELAAALAHELNQPLTAILSTAQAAQRMLGAE